MITVWLFLGAFLIGGIPTGVLISKRKYGLDVREVGSGNIGASNVRRVFGWYAGLLTFLIDFLKGAIPLWFSLQSGLDARQVTLVGVSLVLGHCFSPFLRFRGGKGVATSLGCMAVAEPTCAGISLITYLTTVIFSKTSAIGSLAGVLACLFYCVISFKSMEYLSLVLGLCAIIVIRHQENLKRLYSFKKAPKKTE